MLTRVGVATAVESAVGCGGYYFEQRQHTEKLARELEVKQLKLSAQQEEARLAKNLAGTMSSLAMQKVEDLFATDNAATALAQLARVLRQDPSNHVAAERLISALTHRSFALPS